ncbi:oligomeric Golgi complex subunit 7 [Phycomyces nitens]|nr:oligomeric Golgi complex subunit 7 [Phycomyces nitens]
MEQCKAQLKEAENWSQLENEATKALEQQDYEACALRLQQAQQSLDVFQHTPEFDVRRALLESLQHDLETALHPTVLRALEDQDTRQCQKLYAVFGRIGRSDAFVEIYLTVKSPVLQKGWPGKDLNGPLAGLLREFYERLEERLTAEYVSCAAMFPDPRMVMQALVQRVISTLEPSLGECLEASIGAASSSSSSSCVGLQGVADSYITTEVFGLALERLLAKPPVSTGTLHSRRLSVSHSFSIVPLALRHSDPNAWAYSLYEPFLPIQTKYFTLERDSMSTEIDRLFGNVNETSTMSSVQHVLHIILPRIDTLAREGLERCLQLTHGFGAVGWLKVLGHMIDTTSHQVQRLIRTLPSPGARSGSEDNDGSDFQVGLRLLTICFTVHQHYHDFTHDSSRLLDAVRPLIQQSPPVVRRRSSVADRKRVPEYPYASVALLRSSALNCTELNVLSQKPLDYKPSPSLERLTEASQRFVYDAVSIPITRSLADLRTEIEGATENVMFSRSPSPYMTHVGEQLLMLPQHFEVYADDEALEFQPNTVPFMAQDPSNEDDVVQRWTTSVARGVTRSFVDSLAVLSDLSSEGAMQLQTDMLYLINVLAALDIQPVPELALMCDYMGWDEQKIVKAIWAARKDPTKETKVLKKVAEMRGVVVLEL